MTDELYGDLSIISTKGNEDFARQVDDWIRQWRSEEAVALAQKQKVGADATLFDTDIHVDSFVASADPIRFADGEGKCVLHESMRGHDVYILCDLFNYGVTYKMYGVEQRMSPDDHYQDLKRIIGAIGGKARRISVVMPMIYEGRQDKRSGRESLDCAISLQELVHMGVTNIITFDVHNGGVMNAIPYHGFENVHPTYQMLKALVKKVPDISITSDELVMFSPDEGGMARCVYYSSILGLDRSMVYKRRDDTRVVNGKHPLVAHEYLGGDFRGKDVIVVDDIIASGESMMDVARKIREMGARRVFLFASFGLFCEGLEKIDEAYENGYFDYLFTTNLVYRSPELLSRKWFVEVNLTKYVALLIDTLNHDRSISRLLSNAEKITNLQQAHMKHTEQN